MSNLNFGQSLPKKSFMNLVVSYLKLFNLLSDFNLLSNQNKIIRKQNSFNFQGNFVKSNIVSAIFSLCDDKTKVDFL